MDVGDIIQNGGFVMSGALVVKIFESVRAYFVARNQKTTVEPDPLNVETRPKPEYVTKKDFEAHVAANAKEHENMVSENTREHENLYSRLNRNDRETSEIKGILSAIREDIGLIKHKLFKTGAK